MARIHPNSTKISCSTSDQREEFTIWMKSLIFHGRGCAVYDSNGRLAYRVDNYGDKRHDNLYLMDLHGTVLFEILKKKVRFILFQEKEKGQLPLKFVGIFTETGDNREMGRIPVRRISRGKEACFYGFEVQGGRRFWRRGELPLQN